MIRLIPTHILVLLMLLMSFLLLSPAEAEVPPAEAKKAKPALTVLSYNVHHGRGADNKIDLGRIAKVIKDSGADLVALQEVDKLTSRANGVDQAKELGKLTGMHAVFGKAIDLSSVLMFDIGVYLVVVGAITSIALALEERDRD